MSRKKTEGENNLTNSIYEPDMAPLAKKKTDENENVPVPDSSEKTGVFVKLVCGSTYHTGELIFRKNEVVSVDEALADQLMSTGFFER